MLTSEIKLNKSYNGKNARSVFFRLRPLAHQIVLHTIGMIIIKAWLQAISIPNEPIIRRMTHIGQGCKCVAVTNAHTQAYTLHIHIRTKFLITWSKFNTKRKPCHRYKLFKKLKINHIT